MLTQSRPLGSLGIFVLWKNEMIRTTIGLYDTGRNCSSCCRVLTTMIWIPLHQCAIRDACDVGILFMSNDLSEYVNAIFFYGRYAHRGLILTVYTSVSLMSSGLVSLSRSGHCTLGFQLTGRVFGILHVTNVQNLADM